VPPPVPILSQINPVQNFPDSFPKIIVIFDETEKKIHPVFPTFMLLRINLTESLLKFLHLIITG
jgi:hypothetical protein